MYDIVDVSGADADNRLCNAADIFSAMAAAEEDKISSLLYRLLGGFVGDDDLLAAVAVAVVGGVGSSVDDGNNIMSMARAILLDETTTAESCTFVGHIRFTVSVVFSIFCLVRFTVPGCHGMSSRS